MKKHVEKLDLYPVNTNQSSLVNRSNTMVSRINEDGGTIGRQGKMYFYVPNLDGLAYNSTVFNQLRKTKGF